MSEIRTLSQATEYLGMYFEFNCELRTVMNEETNIVCKSDIDKYPSEAVIIMAQEAQADVRAQIGYLL